MEKVTIEPFNVIGISVRTTNEDNQGAEDIGQLWGTFMSKDIANKIPNKVDNTIYSIYTEYESDHTKPYTTILGCKVKNLENIPEGMVGKSFDGGNYTKLTTRGKLSDGIIASKWEQIWKMDLDRAYTADFEVFGDKAQDPNNAEIYFLIATN